MVLLFSVSWAGCGSASISPDASRPDGPGDLSVLIDPDSLVQQVGISLTLSSTATGGTPPYLYRWDQNDGPVSLTLGATSEQTIDLGVLTAAGRYVFRVVVTDQTGATANDFSVIDLTDSIMASAPELVIVADVVPLSASIGDQPEGTTVAWSVTRGEATLDNPDRENATLVSTTAETIGLRFTVSVSSGESVSAITRDFEVVSVFNLGPEVLVETSRGDFTIRLDGEAAPSHVANFLSYVDDRFYDGLLIHRVACTDNPETGECDPFVIQGGGFERNGGELIERTPTREPIESESPNDRSNGELYSVALALSGGDVNSGTTQFFVNLDTANSFLDDEGFTVFGMISSGTDVIDAIASVERTDNPILGGELSLPIEDVIIERVSRIFP